jgi:hypothetical protein
VQLRKKFVQMHKKVCAIAQKLSFVLLLSCFCLALKPRKYAILATTRQIRQKK